MLRIVLFIFVFGSFYFANGQADPKDDRTEVIRAALEKAHQSGKRSIKGVLFDMRVFDGKLVRVEEDSFTVDSKRKNLPRVLMAIKYDRVLELKGRGIALSYFPDPDLSPFGDWNLLKKLSHGDTLEIDRIEGTNIAGVLLRVSDTGVTFIDGNRTKEIRKDEISRIFLARREPHSVSKVLAGAGRGAGAIGGPGDSSSIFAAAIYGAILAAAATVGAIDAIAKAQKSPNDRLLIYAK